MYIFTLYFTVYNWCWLYIGMTHIPQLSGFAFNIATMWPPSRLPIFIMGILCGLLRNKSITTRKSLMNYTKTDWNRYCNLLWILLNIILIVGVIIERITEGKLNLELWIQLFIVWLQLEFIYGLTSCGTVGGCITYKLLSCKLMLFLGRISYSIYLIHFPIIGYICFILNGKNPMPSCSYNDINNDTQCNHLWNTFLDNRLMPVWCIPIHLTVSFVIAVILNRYFEEPMRKWLRPKKSNTAITIN